MGDEIDRRYFGAEDFSSFRSRLDEETALLRAVFESGELSSRGDVAGFELEAWLVDGKGDHCPTTRPFSRRSTTHSSCRNWLPTTSS